MRRSYMRCGCALCRDRLFPFAAARGLGTSPFDTGISFKRSINHLPAGPGGDFLCHTADIGKTKPPGGTSSICSIARRPSSKSSRTACRGIPPHPRPFRIKWCFANRSARRHVVGDITPSSRPADRSDRSVRTDLIVLTECFFRNLALMQCQRMIAGSDHQKRDL